MIKFLIKYLTNYLGIVVTYAFAHDSDMLSAIPGGATRQINSAGELSPFE